MKRLRQNRVKKPANHRSLKQFQIKYSNAVDLAREIGEVCGRYMSIVSGNFIFGDFIEALVVENNWHVKRLDVSTLSLSAENVDSLENLITGEYVDELNLHTSSYFFSHERNGLVKRIFDKLDRENKFQLTVSGNHTKVTTMELHNGRKVIIHGSANLRSSDCLEQFVVEENEDLFDFNQEFFDILVEKFSTINKEVAGNRGKKLWQVVKQGAAAGRGRVEQKERPNHLSETHREKNKAWEI